jgi:hypothetical protein
MFIYLDSKLNMSINEMINWKSNLLTTFREQINFKGFSRMSAFQK